MLANHYILMLMDYIDEIERSDASSNISIKLFILLIQLIFKFLFM